VLAVKDKGAPAKASSAFGSMPGQGMDVAMGQCKPQSLSTLADGVLEAVPPERVVRAIVALLLAPRSAVERPLDLSYYRLPKHRLRLAAAARTACWSGRWSMRFPARIASSEPLCGAWRATLGCERPVTLTHN
jgi:hypothetical protein